ncbi:MAG: methyltransferase [Anaerolineales bacterium]|nr:methyltransferase [Anaerolineales bacterium]
MITIATKPGLPNWDQLNPSTALIAELCQAEPGQRILYLGIGHGAGAAALAQRFRSCQFVALDLNAIALKMSAQTIAVNQLSNVRLVDWIDCPPEEEGTFDQIIIDLPKGRQLAQRWLLLACEAARLGATLYLSGAREAGIQSVLQDAQALLGEGAILGYKKGNRIGRFTIREQPKGSPEWATRAGIAPHSWIEFDCGIGGKNLRMFSLPGIFSSDRIDAGTRVLVESINIPRGAQVLDLGCGYGLVGIYAAGAGAETTDLIDVNLLAIAATRKNLSYHQIQTARVWASDALEAVGDQRYTHILTNPPFHAGKAVDYQMAQAFIQQSWNHLLPGGQFILVANQFIRYDSLLQLTFQNAHLLVARDGYQVWMAKKS